MSQVVHAAVVNLVFTAAAWRARAVDRSGAIAGFLLGTAIYASLGWRGYVLLTAFVALGSGATRLGYRRKDEAGLAQEAGGRRGARHALANLTVAALAAALAAVVPQGELLRLAFAGALATATADTLGSEIGQLWGRRTFLPTTFEQVSAGTEGAISLEGTLCGFAGALTIGLLGAVLGLVSTWGALAVTLAAVLGSLFESVLGATFGRRGLLGNGALNFLNTWVGALAGMLFGSLVS